MTSPVPRCTCSDCREMRDLRARVGSLSPTLMEEIHNLHTAVRQLGWAVYGRWLR